MHMRKSFALSLVFAGLLIANPAWAAAPADWSVYLHDNARDNAAQDGRTLAASAVHLNETWSMKLGGSIVSSPVIEGGFAYVPSWDGNLYALNLATHQVAWKRFLGTQATWLGPAGVSSPPAFAADIGPHGAILVGAGGQAQATDKHLYFYALDAQTGATLWRTIVGGANSDSIFDSPLYLNGHVYIGTAGSGAMVNSSAPPRSGILFELDGQTAKILHKRAMSVPKGTGGAIWGSVSTNEGGTRVFVPTGDGSNPYVQQLVEGLVAVDPSTLKVLDHWQLPPNRQIVPDNDFGTTVTVFSDGNRTLIGATIKSGTYYALDAGHLKTGPVWKRQLGNSGTGNFYDDICSSAFASGSGYPGGRTLYIAAPNVKIKGHNAQGGLYALNPANGQVTWSVPLKGLPQEGAVTVYDDTVIVPVQRNFFQGISGGTIQVRSALDGHLLGSVSEAGTPFSAPVVMNGTIYVGTSDGVFHIISMTT